MSNFNGQYVVASLDVSGRPDGGAQAHLVSVSTAIDVLRVHVPNRFHQLLMDAKNDENQHRFHFTFESPEDADALPIVSSASRVEVLGSEQPIATHVGCIFCPEEPFNYSTGQWEPSLHSLLVRNATSPVRSLVSQKCTEVLGQNNLLPADHPLLQFDASTASFRDSDADLFQRVEPQRWLNRATLPDAWRRSSWGQRAGRLLSCPPNSLQSRNVEQLQESFISSCSAAFDLFRRSATALPDIQRQFYLGGGSSNSRDKHSLLDCAGESHMDRVIRDLQQECRGEGHPLIASFEEARRQCNQRNAAGAEHELELPFILERSSVQKHHRSHPVRLAGQANPFAVYKLYIVRIRGDLGLVQLSSDALVQTNAFDARLYDASHWSPRFQQLADEAERLGPAAFHRRHRMGLDYGDHRQPSHAAQVCIGRAWAPCERGGNWFQELWRRTEGIPTQDRSAASGALLSPIAIQNPEELDGHVQFSDLASLVLQASALGLNDGA